MPTITTDFEVKTGTTVKLNSRWDYEYPILDYGTYNTPSYIFGHAPGLSAVFTNTSNSGIVDPTTDKVQYIWNFGDYYNQTTNIAYTSSISDNVSHIYMMPGNYTVTLTQNTQSTIVTPITSNICRGRYCIDWYWQNLQSDNVNHLNWKDLSSQGTKTTTWGNSKVVDSNCDTSIIQNTQTVVKSNIVTLDEISPVAILKNVMNSYGKTPLTVVISPEETLCGSFPIEKIDWDAGDGSDIQTVSRYTTPNSNFIYTGNITSDSNDPRNYYFTHTYRISSSNIFYPSITAYSMNTNIFDTAQSVIGPLIYPSISSTPLKLMKVRNSGNVIAYGVQMGDNFGLLKAGITPFSSVRNVLPQPPSNTFTLMLYTTDILVPLYSIGIDNIPSLNGGTYYENSTVTLSAILGDEYSQIYWTLNGDIISRDVTFNIILSSNMALSAYYSNPA